MFKCVGVGYDNACQKVRFKSKPFSDVLSRDPFLFYFKIIFYVLDNFLGFLGH